MKISMRGQWLALISMAAVAGWVGRARAENPLGPPVLPHCLVSLVDEADVPAQEPGVITALTVKEGQRVAKGDLLARIDDVQAQCEKRKAQAEKAAAVEQATNDITVRYAQAEADVALFAYLKSKQAYDAVPGSVTQVDLKRLNLEHERAVLSIDKAKLDMRVAAFTAEEKGAEADAADEAIRRRQIKAPLDGVVSQITPHLGEWVKPGDSVVHILRMDRLQVEGFLEAKQYPQSEIRDRTVTVTLKGAKNTEPVEFTGRIVFVSPQEEAGNEYRIKAEVENRLVPGSNVEWLLHPGTNVTMRIDLK